MPKTSAVEKWFMKHSEFGIMFYCNGLGEWTCLWRSDASDEIDGFPKRIQEKEYCASTIEGALKLARADYWKEKRKCQKQK